MKGQLKSNWKQALEETLKGKSGAFIIFDTNIPSEHVAEVAQALGENTHTLGLTGGENIKTLETAQQIYLELDQAGLDRKSLIICMGGGTISDLGSYVAATFKRGLDHVILPTTLLAAVDAALGGKNGVNLETQEGVIKNQVGTIKQPEFIGYDAKWLESLDAKEVRSGWAEMAKHALINKNVDQTTPAIISTQPYLDYLVQFIESSAAVKMDIVERDELESGERAMLNLGHTTGHAMESLAHTQGDEITHGEGVAWGLAFMLYASKEKKGFNPHLAQTLIKHILENIKNPLRRFDANKIWQLMLKDKKNNSGEVRDVLLFEIGKGDYEFVWDEDEFKALWEQFLSKFA